MRGTETPTVCKMHLSLDVHHEHFIKSRCHRGNRAAARQCWGEDAFSTAPSITLLMMLPKDQPCFCAEGTTLSGTRLRAHRPASRRLRLCPL